MRAEESIAFVILAWNSEDYLRDCIVSVLSIGDLCHSVYVVDNGSIDDTPTILEELSNQDLRLSVITLSDNMGTTVSRNIALRMIPPEVGFVCILDSDTLVNRRAFEILISELEMDKTIGIIGPTLRSPDGEEQLSGRSLPTLGIKLRKAFPYKSIQRQGEQLEIPSTPIVCGLQDVGYLISACWVMRSSIFKQVGLLDERIFYAPEDVDFCLRVRNVGRRIVRCYEAEIVHIYQRISKKKLLSKMNVRHLGGLMYYFIKHGYLFKAPY